MTETDCRPALHSIWVVVDGRGDCVRFFAAGLEKENVQVHVWFHGDRTGMKRDEYERFTPDYLQRLAGREFDRRGIPYVRVSRPGVHGSSGRHRERRRPRENRIMNAALEGLKARFRIAQFALSGQSGGGHVVGALLTMRRDVGCAVITSGATAVRARLDIMGRTRDVTGFSDFYDPIDHVREISPVPGLRIMVVGDPRDVAVPFPTQQAYFEALKARGLDATLIRGRSLGKKHHGLQNTGNRIMKLCIDGASAEEIVRKVE
jgi:pimeloyl-ACP methyl ester carboxylesterase